MASTFNGWLVVATNHEILYSKFMLEFQRNIYRNGYNFLKTKAPRKLSFKIVIFVLVAIKKTKWYVSKSWNSIWTCESPFVSGERSAAWYQRRQMKKIYSPLLEGLLALYLGFEWIQVIGFLGYEFVVHHLPTNTIHSSGWNSIIKFLHVFVKIWQTNNILTPMITHGIYSAVILGHGLWKIHDHRKRLRQRIQQLKVEGKK